jgi:hypothetical protein
MDLKERSQYFPLNTRGTRLITGLVMIAGFQTFAIPPTAAADSQALSHVTLNATLSCKDTTLSPTPAPVDLWLDDAVVTGRQYYPAATVQRLDGSHIQISFDLPGGVYELFAHLKRDKASAENDCSWSGGLMMLPGVERSVSATFKTGTVNLWDRGDFISGNVAGAASVIADTLPRPPHCGSPWKPEDSYYQAAQQHHYYFQDNVNSATRVPALIISDNGHVTVLAMPPINRTPLAEHAYIRRDIMASDLQRWGALPPSTIVCDTESVSYAPPSPAPKRDLQRISVTALVECSDRNDLYSTETPTAEVEDQLHRGRFFFPPTSVQSHIGNVVNLQLELPPGAYDLGLRLPRLTGLRDFALPCYSSARLAVLHGHERHITFLICSCGLGGADRGFVAVRMEPKSMRVAISTLPRSVQCGTGIGDATEAIEQRSLAVLDGGIFYATYVPYDPTKRPALVINGPGMFYAYVALDSTTTDQPMESLHLLDVTTAHLAQWYSTSNYGKLICE